MTNLFITNGDSAADLLAASGLAGTILPWRDILHEGPLVPAESLERLSDIRAAYLSERFGLDFAEIRGEFGARDSVLRHHERFDRIEIWLEHDLYDQLQLLQVLSFFAAEGRTDGLVLVQADSFLGQEKADTIRRFAENARFVDRPMLEAADRVWADLCADTPWPALQRLYSAPNAFPFLAPSLRRFLDELPSPRSGLCRSEAAMLAGIAGYRVAPGSLFRLVLKTEEAAFMGDWSFFRMLEDLAFSAEPLIAGLPGRFEPFGAKEARDAYIMAPIELTPFGQAVFDGGEDHIAVNGIERWWAGTRLSGYDVWRFDRVKATLLPPADAAEPS